MSTQLPDPRRTPYRADLAAMHLQGKVEAPRYVDGARRQVARSAVAMRSRPDSTAGFDTELLLGETVTIYDEGGGWAWGQADRDGYVGYVAADSLSKAVLEPTHRICAIGTFVYARADIKSPPVQHLSINALITVVQSDERFSRLQTGGHIVTRHIAPVTKVARDFVDIAERLTGAPYLWGGRTRVGIDCSGLVQLAMEAAGLSCPRDSDMQQAEVGEQVLVPETLDGLQRGDLVFWQGHVGIMVDGVMLLHANAHHMAVVVEPLDSAAARMQRQDSKIIAIKRPAGLCAPTS